MQVRSLLTNVPRDVDADAVSTLYRLRWHIELVFKDWKSDANLHAFQSEQRHIVEGLIWASLCAPFLKRAIGQWAQLLTGQRISVRLAAMSGAQLMPMVALWVHSRFSRECLQDILDFLLNNALITHPERVPRLPLAQMGLRPRRRLPSVPERHAPRDGRRLRYNL